MAERNHSLPFCVGGYRDASVLRIWGEDAASFLNGMLTQKMTGWPPGSVFSAARTDAKGRVVALFDVWVEAADTFYLLCEGSSAETWADTLDRFVFLEDVEMKALNDWSVYTLQGSGVASVLADAGCPMPEKGSAIGAAGCQILHRSHSLAEGVDVLGEGGALEGFCAALTQVSEGFAELESMRVHAGRVRWPADMAGRTLPHELGLRDTHLHFSKGCYVGQEIIHRLEVRGGIRRQVVVVCSSEPVASGENLLVESKSHGKMLSSVTLDDRSCLGLAQVKVESATVGKTWRTSAGVEVKVVACPHATD